MLPDMSQAAETLMDEDDMEMEASRTYGLKMEQNRLLGMVDELDAMKQAVYKILNTERYQYLIYSWDYGIELKDLIGQPIPYVLPEMEGRVRDALLKDDRITDVTNFLFEVAGNTVRTGFTVHTVFGQINEEVEVEV